MCRWACGDLDVCGTKMHTPAVLPFSPAASEAATLGSDTWTPTSTPRLTCHVTWGKPLSLEGPRCSFWPRKRTRLVFCGPSYLNILAILDTLERCSLSLFEIFEILSSSQTANQSDSSLILPSVGDAVAVKNQFCPGVKPQ